MGRSENSCRSTKYTHERCGVFAEGFEYAAKDIILFKNFVATKSCVCATDDRKKKERNIENSTKSHKSLSLD